MTYYDSISNGYEKLHKEEQLKKIQIIRDNLEIKVTDLMLDIGCGQYFGDFPCKVIGIDPSIELLKKADKNKIQLIKGSAENLPFKDNSFNIIISITAIQNFDNIEKGLSEAKRVGKDKFVFTYLKKSEKAKEIKNKIKNRFKITKEIEENKDMILICLKK